MVVDVSACLSLFVVGLNTRTPQRTGAARRKQANFDDDSPMHARLGRWAEGSEALSKTLMLRRCRLFDVEKGFDDERRKVMDAVEYVLGLWTR